MCSQSGHTYISCTFTLEYESVYNLTFRSSIWRKKHSETPIKEEKNEQISGGEVNIYKADVWCHQNINNISFYHESDQ